MSDDAFAPSGAPGDEVPAIEGFSRMRRVGQGGDSVIYVARQDALDRLVAIKVVNLSDEREVRRFQREIALTVSLGRQHPNIVKVLDTRTLDDGRPAIVMDYYEMGSTFDHLVRNGPFSADEVARIGAVIGDAVDFAHSQGVLHRDVKPQNILMLPTSYLLADFGIARAVDAGETGSLDRLSYRHASPEVLDGEPPTAADDLWSLGSTMFTLLAGRAPFAHDEPEEDTALGYLRRVRSGERRAFPPGTPAALREVIERLLAPRRADRFSSARAVVGRLLALDTRADWSPSGSAAETRGTGASSAAQQVQEPESSGAGASPVLGPVIPDASGASSVGRSSSLPAAARPSSDGSSSDDPSFAGSRSAAASAWEDSGREEDLWAPEAVRQTASSASGKAVSGEAAAGQPVPAASAGGGLALGALAGVPLEETSELTAPHPLRRSARAGGGAAEAGQPYARSLAGSEALATPAGATVLDDEQTSLRPREPEDAEETTSEPSSKDREPDGTPPRKVRGAVIGLAAAMLIASGVLAFFVFRPPTPKVTGAGSGQSIGSQSAPSAWASASAVPTAQFNDPEVAPGFLATNVENGKLTVTFTPPQLEKVAVNLLDITDPNTSVVLSAPQTDITSIEIDCSQLHGVRRMKLVGVDAAVVRVGASQEFTVKLP